VCPEPLVIKPALKGADHGIGPVILSPNCTNCGRCIDVCSKDVFVFATRFSNRSEPQANHQRPATRSAESPVQLS
jgi:ferredoxin-type protein NapH